MRRYKYKSRVQNVRGKVLPFFYLKKSSVSENVDHDIPFSKSYLQICVNMLIVENCCYTALQRLSLQNRFCIRTRCMCDSYLQHGRFESSLLARQSTEAVASLAFQIRNFLVISHVRYLKWK